MRTVSYTNRKSLIHRLSNNTPKDDAQEENY